MYFSINVYISDSPTFLSPRILMVWISFQFDVSSLTFGSRVPQVGCAMAGSGANLPPKGRVLVGPGWRFPISVFPKIVVPPNHPF